MNDARSIHVYDQILATLKDKFPGQDKRWYDEKLLDLIEQVKKNRRDEET